MAAYTNAMSIWILPLLLALALVLYVKNKKKQLLPPGPSKLPFIGNVHQLAFESPHVSLWKLSKKYGDVMHLRLGCVPALVVSSAEAAREVLKTHDLVCCSRPSFDGTRRFSYNHLDVVSSPYGGGWRDARKLSVVNLLSARRVESFGPVREEEVGFMIDSISQSHSSEVNLSHKLHAMTASLICKIAFGETFRDSAKFEELISEAICTLGSSCASDFFPLVGWIVDRLTGFHDRLERSFHDFDAFYQQIIDHHNDPSRKKDEELEDIVDTLLRIQRDQTDAPFGLTNVKAILMNVLVGGSDTSAVTITWAMTELSRNKRVMKKAQDEIRACIGEKGRICASDVGQFQYLKMVVKEAFRLHPPGPLLVPRETVSHFKINGYEIPPNTWVMVNAWAIGRDGNIWENPQEFYPERFEGSPISYKGEHFELLPFGAGRRKCPGISFGMATVELALANLLYNFDWKLPDGMKEEDVNMEEALGVPVRKKLPLKLVPITYNRFQQ